MSRESHHRYLEQAALREAQKAFSRGQERATVRDFLSLRVQTVEPWKRMCCLLIGCGFGAVAVWLAVEHETNLWAVGFLAALSLLSIIVGIIGWKRPVEVVLNSTADAL